MISFIKRLLALLKPDPEMQSQKAEFDRAYLRFIQEVRHIDALIVNEPEKEKHEQR